MSIPSILVSKVVFQAAPEALKSIDYALLDQHSVSTEPDKALTALIIFMLDLFAFIQTKRQGVLANCRYQVVMNIVGSPCHSGNDTFTTEKFAVPVIKYMINTPHEIMAQVLVEFSRNLLKDLAENYGGECTLNELRVMNQILRCHLVGQSCSVTALHKVTGIPIPTVSRSVAHLQSEGWLSERRDPDDGRKRIISLGPRSLELTWDDINGRVQWFKDFREHGLPG